MSPWFFMERDVRYQATTVLRAHLGLSDGFGQWPQDDGSQTACLETSAPSGGAHGHHPPRICAAGGGVESSCRASGDSFGGGVRRDHQHREGTPGVWESERQGPPPNF